MENRKRKRWLIAILFLAFLGIGAYLILSREPEPTYGGKPLSDWLLEYQDAQHSPPGSAFRTIPEAGIRAIGTNALPILQNWLAGESAPWRQHLLKRLPSRLRNNNRLIHFVIGSASQRHSLAQLGYMALGTNAAPAIPGLQKLASRLGNSAVRLRAVEALADIGPNGIAAAIGILSNFNQPSDIWMLDALPAMGTNAAPLVPVISSQLQNTDGDFAVITLAALGNMKVDLSAAVPVLTRCLDDPRSSIRMTAIPVLEGIGPAAAAALPALERLHNDPDQYIRFTSAEAIEKITGKPPTFSE